MKPNKRTVGNIGIPIKKDGDSDKRYTIPQVLKNDGSRDMRCKKIEKVNK